MREVNIGSSPVLGTWTAFRLVFAARRWPIVLFAILDRFEDVFAFAHGVASRELRHGAFDIFLRRRWQTALFAVVVGDQLEVLAVLDIAAVVGAIVCGLLQKVDVPAVDKISVESSTIGIAHGEDERVLIAFPFA